MPAERQVGAAPVSPVKAKFVSDSGAQLSVVVRPAAEIKPTFLQVIATTSWINATDCLNTFRAMQSS